MQMNKPKDLTIDAEAVAMARKMKHRQEPLAIKAGMILRFFQDAKRDSAEREVGE